MKKLNIFLLIVCASLLIINGCRKNNDNQPDETPIENTSTQKTTIVGRVLDDNNAPLNAVTVTAYGQTVQTDQDGLFVLKNVGVNKDRCIVHFSKTGFFNRAQAFIPTINSVNYLKIVLISNTITQSISAASGGTVSLPDQSSVQFQANSFQTDNGTAYNGTVNVALKHLSPDDANFAFTIPGGDLAAKDAGGNDVILYSYGMLGVEITGSAGQSLRLSNSFPATLTIPIAVSQQSTAPATIPLWTFDPVTSLWKVQGTAIQAGNSYTAPVTNLNWLNVDQPQPSATIIGKVIDCFGDSVPNAIVTISGGYSAFTDQDGMYSISVPTGMPLTAQVLASNNSGLFNSQLENIPSLSNNQVFIVPDLVTTCPARIEGTLKSCTGENTYGIISASNGSNYFRFTYALDGLFKLAVPPSAQLSLNAINDAGSLQMPVNTPSSSNTINVGDITLCSAVNPDQNWFVLNGGGFNNQLFVIDTILTDNIHSGSTYCYVKGTNHETGVPTYLQLYFNGNTMGIYGGYLDVDIDGTLGLTYDYSSGFGSNITFQVVKYENIGGRIVVLFSGQFPNSQGGLNVVGKINVARRE